MNKNNNIIYVDGKLVGMKTVSDVGNINSKGPLFIGKKDFIVG